MTAPEEILIDGNDRATGHGFYQLAALEAGAQRTDAGSRSPRTRSDVGSSRKRSLKIEDRANCYLRHSRTVEAMAAWASDDATVVYIRKDPVTLVWAIRLYKHVRGTPVERDPLVYTQDDDSFYLSVAKSKTDRFIFINAQSTVSSEVRYADAHDSRLRFRRLRSRANAIASTTCTISVIASAPRRNWQAKTFRIVEVPIEKVSDRTAWRDVIAHRTDAFVGEFDYPTIGGSRRALRRTGKITIARLAQRA
jgi:oligopeptidase B